MFDEELSKRTKVIGGIAFGLFVLVGTAAPFLISWVMAR
jgi:hypothetical protein